MSKVIVPPKLIKMFDEIKIIQKYESKKNQAIEIQADEKKYILKLFSDQRKQYLQSEVSVLSCAKQDLIPSLIAYDEQDSFLMLEKIPGNNLCDALNDTSIDGNKKKKLVILLAEWFATFHKDFSMTSCATVIRADSILRNFLINDDRIIGVDFEEAQQANPWEDIGEICASILDTNPMFTEEKIKLVQIFLKSYEEQVLWKSDEEISIYISKYLHKHLRFRSTTTAKKMKDFANTMLDESLL